MSNGECAISSATDLNSMFETHYKSNIVLGSFFVTTIGWFAWNCFLSGVFAASPSGPYAIRDTFIHLWGDDPVWWATMFVVLGILGLIELAGKTVKRNLRVAGLWKLRPWRKDGAAENAEEVDLEVWQEMEQDPVVRERLRRMARDEPEIEDDEEEIIEVDMTRS